MVNGHEKMTADGVELTPCAVVDLDGTLLRGNSFRLFIRFLAGKLRRERRYASLSRIIALLAARRLRLISHVGMKYPIHSLASRIVTDAELADFTNRILLPAVNVPLLDELKRLKASGHCLLLATAAPDLYVPHLCLHLGFDAWTATPLSSTLKDYAENRGARKRDGALDFARQHGCTIAVVATDHEDDLPLLLLPDLRRLLVNPTPVLRTKLSESRLTFHEF